MMMVSRRLQEAIDEGAAGPLVEEARTQLYRGQCNCGYWHGAFGGIYLPHLRNAVYRSLIAADNLLDRAAGRPETWVDATADDFNFDARQEVRLANDKLMGLMAPSRGGQFAELDVRQIQHNLLATLTRQPEAYHRKVLAGGNRDERQRAPASTTAWSSSRPTSTSGSSTTAIRGRASWTSSTTTTPRWPRWPRARPPCASDFVDAAYEARIRRNPDRIQVQLVREGDAGGVPVRITKGLTLDAGSATLEIAYLLENLPPDRPLHFAVEMNFAGLPAGADDRYFHDLDGNRLGQLGTRLDLCDAAGLGLCDEWLGIDVALKTSRPTHFWTFPVETVSQSEGRLRAGPSIDGRAAALVRRAASARAAGW